LILIQIAPDSGIQKELAGIILNETSDPANANGREIRYENGCRFIRTMQRFQPAGNLSLVPGGVYLITGGSGGLGMIFARYLAEHYRARLILTGRSPLEKDKLEQLKALENLGAEAAYIRTDISKLAEVKRLITMIRQKYLTIHGVIHSAGVSGGPLVGQSDKASFEKVLQPKVQGLINLDMALGEEKIDFLVMFSSIAAVVGDFGGCSYAVANSFMDRFARFREQLRLEGKRSGKTLSINWALWKEGGLGLGDSELRDYYFKYSGMQALETAWGIKAFRAAMAAEAVQVVVASGVPSKLDHLLHIESKQDIPAPDTVDLSGPALVSGDMAISRLYPLVVNYLKEMISKAIDLPVNRLNARAAFEKYGIDSISIMDLNAQLEKDFDSLPKILLFEHNSIDKLANYLIGNYSGRLYQLYNLDEFQNESAVSQSPGHEAIAGLSLADEPFPESGFTDWRNKLDPDHPLEQASFRQEDVAIIGASNEYPSEAFKTYWKNLREDKAVVIGELNPVRDYLNLVMNHDRKMLHLLVKSKTMGKKLEVIVAGQGKPVLLIPAFGFTARQWVNQLREWPSKYQLLIIHTPGVGLSETGEDYSFTGISKIFMEILEELNIKCPFHLIGSSWGGMLAQTMAREYPDQVRSLTLAGSFCRFEGYPDKIAFKDKIRLEFEYIAADYNEFLESECIRLSEVPKYMQYSKDGLLFSTVDVLSGIHTPTLIVVGKKDLLIDPKEFQFIHERISGSKLYEIPAAGHIPNITHPRQFNKIVQRFWEELAQK